VELSCELSPLVFAELYRLMARPQYVELLVERLYLHDRDHDWLSEAAIVYDDFWQSELAVLPDGGAASVGLSREHALLATWLLAALRPLGESTGFSGELRRLVAERLACDFPEMRSLPTCFVPSVVCWTLGAVVGDFDVNYPVLPAYLPSDPDVSLAYYGLVEHLVHLGALGEVRPEVMCTAVLWRAAGLAEGLRPETKNPSAALSMLMREIQPMMPEIPWERLRKHWIDFPDRRNVLTHLKTAEGGQISFQDSADIAKLQGDLLDTIIGISHFVCHEVSTELSDDTGQVVRSGLWDEQLWYEIQTYDER
jgi:hypothetical protein